MRTLKVLVLLTFCFAGIAAIAQEPDSQKTPDAHKASDNKPAKATVYIYRYKQFTGSALSPSVYCDETELARIENGRYFAVKVDPGKHVFRSNDKQSGTELDAKAGQQYFLRVELVAGAFKGHGRLIQMSPEQGGYELSSSKLKPLDAKKVVDTALVSVDEVHPEAPAATTKPAVMTETH